MTDESNETVLRNMIKVFWNEKNLDSYDDFFCPDAVLHPGKTDYSGVDGFKNGYAGRFMAAFTDLHHDIEFLIVEDGLGAMRFHGTGTLEQDYNDLTANGQKLDYHGTAFFRLTDGRIAEVWSHSDMWQWADAQR